MTSDVSAATDVEVFAQAVLGRPLWAHQVELLRSPARYRVVTAGRQSGKSTALSTEALFTAATRRNALVLVVSAGEVAARRLLADAADVAQASPLLRGSVLDETRGSLSLSNGSRILSVPASQRQIRGWPVDLLIVDEAGFVDEAVWRAAEPAIIARLGSKVILSSSPWGGHDHFFRSLWQRGMDAPDEQVAAWHWPSSVSPLVDTALLEQIRVRETPEYFAREFLAEWTDEVGLFFTESELMKATANYQMTPPEEVANYTSGDRWDVPVAGGVDFGVARDANAIALVGLLKPESCSDGRWRFFVPWLRAEYEWQWDAFLEYVVGCCRGYGARVVASERNGVGSWPTDDLKGRVMNAGLGTWVLPVWTDLRRKQSGFSKIKMLLQSDRLVLPKHPELLKQLRSLEFEQLAAGGMRIAVPERSGHDDLCLAFMQAISTADGRYWVADADTFRLSPPDPNTTVETGGGVAIPRRPLPAPSSSWIRSPSGFEKSDGW